jgi:HK97 family phage major capsid protein
MRQHRNLEDLTQEMSLRNRAHAFTKWAASTVTRALAPGSLIADDPDLALFERAAVLGHSSGNDAALLQQSMEFAALVARKSILGQLGTLGALRANFGTRVVRPTGEPVASWVGALSPIPAGRFELASNALPSTALASLVVATEELLRDTTLRPFETQLRRAAVRSLDRAVLNDDAAVAGVSPAGLLHGVSAVGAGSPENIDDNLLAVWEAVSDAEPDAPVWICSSRAAVYLASLLGDGGRLFPGVSVRGGDIYGAPQLVSPSAGSKLILVDASAVAYADHGLLVEASRNATLQQDDNPASPANHVSMFQANSAAVRLIHHTSWAKLAGHAVSFVELPIGVSPA